jgi:hypothetical protein
VAKRFLTELNGFDFLLDRLFSKVEEDDKEESVVNLQEALLSEEGPLNGVSNNDEGIDEDYIINIAKSKVANLKKELSGKTKTESTGKKNITPKIVQKLFK